MVLAVVALSVATSQAALVSLYTFDGNASNLVIDARNSTLVNGPKYVVGAVGTNAIDFNGTNYVDSSHDAYPQTHDAYGSNAGGLWTGSTTIWIKTTDITTPTIARICLEPKHCRIQHSDGHDDRGTNMPRILAMLLTGGLAVLAYAWHRRKGTV
jgi:hypothetical protein